MSKRNLTRAFERAGIKHAKAIANYVFDQVGYAENRHGEEKGFWLSNKNKPFKDDNYRISDAVATLVHKGFVRRRGETDFDRYYLYPTEKLLKYYYGHLTAIEAKLADHDAQLKAIWGAIRSIEKDCPPVTEEKIQSHLKLVATEPLPAKRRASTDW